MMLIWDRVAHFLLHVRLGYLATDPAQNFQSFYIFYQSSNTQVTNIVFFQQSGSIRIVKLTTYFVKWH